MVGLDLSKGMAHEASARVPTARRGVADAQALPLKNASLDRAVARHMLHHVPDIPSALRELRRVLRPRGLAVVTTNGAESLPSLRALRRRASEAVGLPAAPSDAGGTFSSKNAGALLHNVFDRVECTTVENALTFTEAVPAVRYVESTFTLGGVAADSDLRDALRSWLMAAVTAEINAGRGVFRDPKYVVFYVAEVV
jgi:ubiquinone/menaquinone biosynthesis C-methylase UbiE